MYDVEIIPIVQEQSQTPVYDFDGFASAARTLVEAARAGGAAPFLFMTWFVSCWGFPFLL